MRVSIERKAWIRQRTRARELQKKVDQLLGASQIALNNCKLTLDLVRSVSSTRDDLRAQLATVLQERLGMIEEISTLRGELEKFIVAAAPVPGPWVN